MCFSSPSMPKVQKPVAGPSERDGNLDGVKKRQQAAGATQETTATSPLGVTGAAQTFSPTLGG